MMVNFTEDTCHVVVHTANMLRQDWEDKTDAFWVSPPLRLLDKETETVIGTNFKNDLCKYLRSYKRPAINDLASRLEKYDFSPVNVIFIASVPGRYPVSSHDYGLLKLRHALQNNTMSASADDTILAQVSSYGSIGAPYYKEIQNILSTPLQALTSLRFKLIFPTMKNVKDSLFGLISGSSIFFNSTSAGGKRQLIMSKDSLCQWHAIKAGRDSVLPHVKTYMRYRGDDIKWCLLTSANLSKSAWGATENGVFRIQSYEAGVLILPSLYGHDTMTASYKSDSQHNCMNLRMPYDLPPRPYTPQDERWSPQKAMLQANPAPR